MGKPTAAAQAFARKAGVGVEALEKISTPKGEYVSANVLHRGREASEVLGDLLGAELAALYWPKTMYWRPLKPERFVRPVRWMVALLDHAILTVEFAGVRAANLTWGHRILRGDTPVTIDHPDDYVGVLEAAKVTADVKLRQHRIRKALDLETRSVPGGRWREDAALLETVTHLTEWPSVVLGNFDPEYLQLPEEVLVTVMRDHQKYFAVESAAGKLEPCFLAVLNTHPEEMGIDVIRHGHERVLRARFSDARFFWTVDQKTPLEDRVEMLQAVTFHKELGSYGDKTRANLQIAERLAGLLDERGTAVDRKALLKAVELAKTDLTTELVKEFTELQGIVGGLYARAQGLGENGGAGDLLAVFAGGGGGSDSADGGGAGAGNCGSDSDDCGDVLDWPGADGVEGSVCAAASGERHREDSGGDGIAAGALGPVESRAGGSERRDPDEARGLLRGAAGLLVAGAARLRVRRGECGGGGALRQHARRDCAGGGADGGARVGGSGGDRRGVQADQEYFAAGGREGRFCFRDGRRARSARIC